MSIFNGTMVHQLDEILEYSEVEPEVRFGTYKSGFSQCGNNNNS